ncbi:MAG: outer membrane beta-barrel protein [Polaribacter sp.]
MSNQNIDRLFQEKLKNLDMSPNDKVWDSIASKLTQKKRRIIPIWWFTSGIAALFILGFLLFPFVDDNKKPDKNDTNSIITETNNEVKKPFIKNDLTVDSIYKNDAKKIVVADKKTKEKKFEKEKKLNTNTSSKKKLVSPKNAVKKNLFANNTINKNKEISKKEFTFSDKNKDIGFNKNDAVIKKEIPKNKEKTEKPNVNLDTFLKKKDSIIITKPSKNKWAVTPLFGLLNSNSFTKASPISSSLANSTQGKSSVSYGVQVSYQINKKWSVQTGIHQQEMGYINNQVAAVAVTSANASSITFNNKEAFSFQEDTSNANLNLNVANLNGDLNQTIGYLEIPIEIKYNFLSTKKINTQVVAGFSSLFLNKNQIDFNTPFQSNSGENQNLNTINFSGNFGIDFDYLFNKKWSFNLNPMFKAQLNTFSSNPNGFAPFNIGVYTGLKYRF